MAHDSSASSSSQHLHRHQPSGYANFSSPAVDPDMQSFQPSHEGLYGLQTASDAWRAFFPSAGGGGMACFPPQPLMNENLMCPWQPPNRMLVDESPARFLFPSSASAASRAGGGLSLSLNHPAAAEASNSGAAAAVSYEPQPPLFHQLVLEHKPADYLHQHDGRGYLQSSGSQPANNPYYNYNHQLKNSKFLLSARELLNEFCNVEGAADSSKQNGKKNKQCEEGGATSSSSTAFNQSFISSLDIHELQGRKAKLLAMLEEVDRRYRRYREQMRAVAESFEAAAGEGAAAAYVALASRVMSTHFRCLRDCIVGQIHAIRKAAGERDEAAVAQETTRGDTPRLKVIDQCLRHQRAFPQAGSMECHHPWRPQRGLPERSVSILRAWLFEHFLHPYPSDVDKHILARQTGLSRSQVSNWFINARVRLWKPMVEEMYLEETKEHDTSREENDHVDSSNVNIFDSPEDNMEEQKPPALHGPDSLSWVIMSNPHERVHQPIHGSGGSGVIELDFASYSQQQQQMQWGGSGGGVSLTLGLQQHDDRGGGGMGLSFSPPTAQQQQQPAASMLFGGGREQMESQFSMLDGEGQINMPYRNLMGAQLLRDLAG